ncbi:hypothetical protein WMF93_09970 [Pseudomonas alkylphenolica]
MEHSVLGRALSGLFGQSTSYRYDERQYLVAVTDALQQTTTLERKPDGEVLRINHPDGTAENFTYNVYGQVLSHADGKGQVTRLQRTARGLPSSRQDAEGQQIRYEYDKANCRCSASKTPSATSCISPVPRKAR